MFSIPWSWKSKGRVTPLTYKKEWKVYCKQCEYFFSKSNDLYYMNTDNYPTPNPIPSACRGSTYKWHVECHHPENHKEKVTYIECFDEVKENKYKDVKSPRTLNYNNDCHWFTKKEEEEPDWEK